MKIWPPSRRAILLSLAALLLVASSLILAAPAIVNSRPFKAKIASLLTSALNRGVHIHGGVLLQLGRNPTLLISDASIDNPSELSSSPMLSVGSLKVSAPLFESLLGRYQIDSIELIDVNVQIATTNAGRSNWSFSRAPLTETTTAAAADPTPLVVPHVNELLVKNLQVSLETESPHRHLTVKELVIRPGGVSDRSSISGSCTIDDTPIELKGEIGSIASYVSGKDLDFNVDLLVLHNRVAAQGTLASAGALSLQMTATGSDFSSLGAPIRLSLPKWTDYEISCQLTKAAGDLISLKVTDLKATLSGSTIRGNATINESGVGSYKVATDLAVASHHITADVLIQPDGTVKANLATSLPDLSQLSPVALAQLPPIKELSFKGKVHYAPLPVTKSSVGAEEFSLRIGESDLSGTAEVQLSPLKVIADIKSKSLNLATLSKAYVHHDTSTTTTTDEPRIPFDLLKAINADVRLTVDQLKTTLGLELGATQLALSLRDGVLSIPHFSSQAFDGHFTASLHAANQDLALKLRGEHFKGNPVMLLAGATPLLEGAFDFSADLKSSGDTLAEILETLTGTISLASEDAKLKHSSLAAASAGLFDLLSPIFGGSAEARSDCLLFEYDLKNGVARGTKQVVKLGEVFIFGKGDLNLLKRTLRYNFNVNSTNPSFASLIPPFRAFGSMSNPHFVPSATGSIASVFDSAEGVVDSAMGTVTRTANFVLARPGERLVGHEQCIKALAVEHGRISSRVGSLLE